MKTMIISFRFSTYLIFNCCLVYCLALECPANGQVGVKKVPDILGLIDAQNGYFSTVEVNTIERASLVHEWYNVDQKTGFIDLEAINQDGLNRRYYYYDTGEKLAVRDEECTRLELSMEERVESVREWFEPMDIVAKSEIFKLSEHLGPSLLMIYAHSISDKAQFVGTELIDGRSIYHWFHCTADGPYIDFYFDVKTSHPFRFSLFYPGQGVGPISTLAELEKDRHTSYVYNFFIFKPLVITKHEPTPYPVGYGCTREGDSSIPLPNFTSVPKFTLDMEAVITYKDHMIKSTARVMKYGDVYSYEITEGSDFVRSIENPPPLGRWVVDRHNGSCRYMTSNYYEDTTLVTRWPYHTDLGFNLLYYIVMKPSPDHAPQFIGNIDLGPVRIEEYYAENFFNNRIRAVVDYYYPVKNGSIDENKTPSKIVFTREKSDLLLLQTPETVEVTIIDYRTERFDIEDRFDVSGCYEDKGSYAWFQLVFSDPWLSTSAVYPTEIRSEIQSTLATFIPITRISDIVVDTIDSNTYVTVKLNDRIHFIEAYERNDRTKITNPNKVFKEWRVEDCEHLCTSNPDCRDFSFCTDDFSCSLITTDYRSETDSSLHCNHYSIERHNGASEFIRNNMLSSLHHVLHQIRRRVDSGLIKIPRLTAEDMFVVHGPQEIGDLSQEYEPSGNEPIPFHHGDEYPIIKAGSRLDIKRDGIITSKTKVDYMDCLRLCSNDDSCYTVSYCPNQNEECILSTIAGEGIEAYSTRADGCNVYEKSYLDLFRKYPGKSLVNDAASTSMGGTITQCANDCIKSNDFDCESFDYCSNTKRNETICFLHVNHIATDTNHQLNGTNVKLADQGCDHFSKKSDLDYKHVIGHVLKLSSHVITIHENISLENCADRCNHQRDEEKVCFTFEFCESVVQVEPPVMDPGLLFYSDYYDATIVDRWVKTACKLSSIAPATLTNTQDPRFVEQFDRSTSSDNICSVYVNSKKIVRWQSQTHESKSEKLISSKDRTSLALGLSAFFFSVAFAIGLGGFIYARKANLISI